MLVTFEGQPGAGKSVLIAEVERQLRDRGVDCAAVGESSARWRPMPEGATSAEVVVYVLEAVLDLYHQDAQEIGPALSNSDVVLKDRHMDAAIYTFAPLLGRLTAFSQERGVVLLGLLLSELRNKPEMTIYVDASLPTRVERIEACRRELHGDLRTLGAPAIEMFDAYARVADQLISNDPQRFMTVDNDGNSVHQVAAPITEAICARLEGGEDR